MPGLVQCNLFGNMSDNNATNGINQETAYRTKKIFENVILYMYIKQTQIY